MSVLFDEHSTEHVKSDIESYILIREKIFWDSKYKCLGLIQATYIGIMYSITRSAKNYIFDRKTPSKLVNIKTSLLGPIEMEI